MPFDQTDLASIYDAGPMLPEPLPEEPFGIFQAWFDRAHDGPATPNPNAMTVATAEVGEDGVPRPSARIVLCKAICAEPGFIVFYTNYDGRKGQQLAAVPHAAAVFHFDALDLQVRIEGPVVKSPAEESDAYFATRAWESRVGAWASAQSEPIESRQAMMDRVQETMRKLGLDGEHLHQHPHGGRTMVDIPRPSNWGGYRLWARRMELWCGGTGRVHDRAVWTRDLTPAGAAGGAEGGGDGGFTPGPWSVTRLQP